MEVLEKMFISNLLLAKTVYRCQATFGENGLFNIETMKMLSLNAALIAFTSSLIVICPLVYLFIWDLIRKK